VTSTSTQLRQSLIGTSDGLVTSPPDEHRLLTGAAVTAVHAAGDDVWVLVGGHDLLRLRGDDVETVATVPDGAGGCIATHAGTVWVGGRRAALWRLIDGTLAPVESFQSAPTHDEWHTPWGGPPDIFSMASDGTHLYVGVHVGGILRTVDGESWTATIDLHDDVHQVAVGADGTVWAATGRRGLAESDDRGATWRYHVDGLHARYALAVAPVTGGALVAVSSGHAGRDGAVYRLDGGRLRRCNTLPDELHGAVGPRQLAATGAQAVVSLPSGDVHQSHDAGAHWTRIATALPDVSEVTLR